jgi:hypothetical protein
MTPANAIIDCHFRSIFRALAVRGVAWYYVGLGFEGQALIEGSVNACHQYLMPAPEVPLEYHQ